jgi:hypothetical protein
MSTNDLFLETKWGLIVDQLSAALKPCLKRKPGDGPDYAQLYQRYTERKPTEEAIVNRLGLQTENLTMIKNMMEYIYINIVSLHVENDYAQLTWPLTRALCRWYGVYGPEDQPNFDAPTARVPEWSKLEQTYTTASFTLLFRASTFILNQRTMERIKRRNNTANRSLTGTAMLAYMPSPVGFQSSQKSGNDSKDDCDLKPSKPPPQRQIQGTCTARQHPQTQSLVHPNASFQTNQLPALARNAPRRLGLATHNAEQMRIAVSASRPRMLSKSEMIVRLFCWADANSKRINDKRILWEGRCELVSETADEANISNVKRSLLLDRARNCPQNSEDWRHIDERVLYLHLPGTSELSKDLHGRLSYIEDLETPTENVFGTLSDMASRTEYGIATWRINWYNDNFSNVDGVEVDVRQDLNEHTGFHHDSWQPEYSRSGYTSQQLDNAMEYDDHYYQQPITTITGPNENRTLDQGSNTGSRKRGRSLGPSGKDEGLASVKRPKVCSDYMVFIWRSINS